jgi:hypothetical protein
VKTLWFSPDGTEWTAIGRHHDVIGVSDGFIAGGETSGHPHPGGCCGDGTHPWSDQRNLGHPEAGQDHAWCLDGRRS